MADECATVKVLPWGEGQGDFVEINADDFNDKDFTLYVESEAPKPVAKTKVAKPVEATVAAPVVDPNSGWGEATKA